MSLPRQPGWPAFSLEEVLHSQRLGIASRRWTRVLPCHWALLHCSTCLMCPVLGSVVGPPALLQTAMPIPHHGMPRVCVTVPLLLPASCRLPVPYFVHLPLVRFSFGGHRLLAGIDCSSCNFPKLRTRTALVTTVFLLLLNSQPQCPMCACSLGGATYMRNLSRLACLLGPAERCLALPRLARISVCYTEKAPNAWQCRGTQKTRSPTINPIGPTDKPHRLSTKHNRKDSPGDAHHQLKQQPCTTCISVGTHRRPSVSMAPSW